MRALRVLRRYRASSSYLPICTPCGYRPQLRRYRASSSYLPPSAVRRRTCRLHRYRASSRYFPAALSGIQDVLLRRYRASSSYLPGNVPLERSICFAGTALLAVTCHCRQSEAVACCFAGTALRAATYPSRWARFSPASFVGIAFFSTRLPLSRESEGARGPRENDTSSIAISNFNVCRIMRFIDTSLRAAACSELLNSRGVYFAGNALRAAAYRNSPQPI